MSRRLSEKSSILLDLFRGLSAQIVVLGHGIFLFDLFNWDRRVSLQESSVLVFFILSGFVITYSSYNKREQGFGFKRFIIDRFSRIYPPLCIALLFTLLLDSYIVSVAEDLYPYHDNFNSTSFLGTLFNLQGFPIISKLFSLESFGTARPAWSLAIEWWIYIGFGYIFYVFTHLKKLQIHHLLVLVLVCLSPIANLLSENSLTLSWIFGLLAFYLFQSRTLEHLKKSSLLVFISIALAILVARYVSNWNEFDLLYSFFISLILLLTIEFANHIDWTSSIKKIIRGNARYSYTLYLTHVGVLNFFYLLARQYDPHLLFILSFITSNIVAFGLGYIGETIMSRRLKTYLLEKQST